jgi:hypothetical protein
MMIQHARWNTFALILTDLVLTAGLFSAAFYIRFLSGWIPPRYYPSYLDYLTILFLATILGVLFLNAVGAYEPRRTSATFSDVPLIFKATVLLMLTLSAFNSSDRDVVIPIGERFAQIVFERLDAPSKKVYAERSGNYQGQRGVKLA